MKSMAEELLEKHVERLNKDIEAALEEYVHYSNLAAGFGEKYNKCVDERTRCTIELMRLRHG